MKDQDGKEVQIRLVGAHLYVANALFLIAIAFGLHYVWENLQCPLFFIHREGNAPQIVMLIVTGAIVGSDWRESSLHRRLLPGRPQHIDRDQDDRASGALQRRSGIEHAIDLHHCFRGFRSFKWNYG